MTITISDYIALEISTSIIAYPNLFSLYEKVTGMTGTDETDKIEFKKIYKQKIISLSTIKKMIRNKLSDLSDIDEDRK